MHKEHDIVKLTKDSKDCAMGYKLNHKKGTHATIIHIGEGFGNKPYYELEFKNNDIMTALPDEIKGIKDVYCRS